MGSRLTWFSALVVCQAAWLPGGVPSRSAMSFQSPRTAAATMNADASIAGDDEAPPSTIRAVLLCNQLL